MPEHELRLLISSEQVVEEFHAVLDNDSSVYSPFFPAVQVADMLAW